MLCSISSPISGIGSASSTVGIARIYTHQISWSVIRSIFLSRSSKIQNFGICLSRSDSTSWSRKLWDSTTTFEKCSREKRLHYFVYQVHCDTVCQFTAIPLHQTKTQRLWSRKNITSKIVSNCYLVSDCDKVL